MTTLAGATGLSGYIDGEGAAARFLDPVGVAVDGAGNVYVADDANDTVRKVSAVGVVTTLAGAGLPGSIDGAGASARFQGPFGIAIDGAGNAYVADFGNKTIRKISAAGVVTTLAGAAGMSGSTDGTGVGARFEGPLAAAADGAGNIYVVDNDNTIRKLSAAGVVTTLAGAAGMSGSDDGGTTARFNSPSGVAVDSAGNAYVTDTGNHTVRKVSPAGLVSTLAGGAGMPGSVDGMGGTARFNGPFGIAVDGAGSAYVSDGNTIRKVTASGDTVTVAGVAGVSGTVLGATPRFSSPAGLAIVGDALVIVDGNAVLLLRHVVR